MTAISEEQSQRRRIRRKKVVRKSGKRRMKKYALKVQRAIRVQSYLTGVHSVCARNVLISPLHSGPKIWRPVCPKNNITSKSLKTLVRTVTLC
jgi:hypothetical protein